MFTSLEFHNFRGFTALKLEGLKRVNLVVGRNNSGKTSLLEGIALLSDPHRFNEMPGLLRANSGLVEQRYFRWLLRDGAPKEHGSLVCLTDAGQKQEVILRRNLEGEPLSPGYQTMAQNRSFIGLAPINQASLRCRIVSVQHRSPADLVKLFAQAVRQKGGEEQVEGLLKAVDERIQKVRVEPADDGIHIMVDLGLSEMVPVSQVGQGIYRLIAIFSELIGEQPQISLIDEVENGIHHSMLEQVWTGIAEVAESLNMQVFVTTHSQECIEAAHAAFEVRKNYDFSIIQLFRVADGVQGRVLDRKHIEAAMAGEIDLR